MNGPDPAAREASVPELVARTSSRRTHPGCRDRSVALSIWYRVVQYLTATLAAVYVGVVWAAGWLTGWLVDETGPWPHLAAGITAAVAFGPLRARVGGWLDRRFFRDRRQIPW